MKTVDGKFFPLPIYFDLDEMSRKKLVGINKFNLIFKQKKIGVFQIDEIYEINKKKLFKMHIWYHKFKSSRCKKIYKFREIFYFRKI